MNIKSYAPRFLNNVPRGYKFDVGDREQIASYRAKAERKRRKAKHVRLTSI